MGRERGDRMHKNGKKPTLFEKKIINAAHLKVENWLVQRKDNEYIYVINKYTKSVRKLSKELAMKVR